jgi:hypothetical protein
MYMLNHHQHINRNKAIKITGFERPVKNNGTQNRQRLRN